VIQPTATTEHVILTTLPEIDRLIFGEADPFRFEAAEEARLRLSFVRDALLLHREGCPEYGRFLERLGFEVETLQEPADLDRVPQLPTSIFKRLTLTSLPVSAMEKRCTSSGTAGTLSVVWRDRTTLDRLLGSLRVGIGLIASWFDDEAEAINLGPDRQQAGDLWFSYVMSLVELVSPTRHCVDRGELDLAAAAGGLLMALARAAQVALVGPPALAVALAEDIQRRGITVRGGDRLTVVTGGGWKRDRESALDKGAFRRLMVETLGLEGEERVRDAFNQVELNTIVMECEHHGKHVPPWLHVTIRDPRTLQPVPPGVPGLLSYLDPSAASYPCFIIADDVGMLRSDPCRCGRPGRTVELIRRVEQMESWGCAIKMGQAYLQPAG
jgi:long-chain-fatty-acid---luciferin-component ligase